VEETNDGGSVLARHTTAGGSYYGPWLHLWRSDGSSRFPLYEGIGAARRLVDGSATITDTPGSGMLQLGQRYYWPEIGRFVHQDPMGDGMNWYGYVGNNPVVWVDPEGLWSVSFDAYPGVGMGFTIGHERGRGWFGKVRAGFGLRIAGALSVDPTTRSPGSLYRVPTGGTQVGLAGSLGFKIYHVGKAAQYTIGTAYDKTGKAYMGPPWGTLSSPETVKLPVGFNIGGSIAAEGAFFSGPCH